MCAHYAQGLDITIDNFDSNIYHFSLVVYNMPETSNIVSKYINQYLIQSSYNELLLATIRLHNVSWSLSTIFILA